MLNLMSLMAPSPANANTPPGVTAPNPVMPEGLAGLLTHSLGEGFLDQLMALIGENNANAAASTGEMDLESLMAGMQKQGEQLVGELLSLLQATQLLKAEMPELQKLDPTALEPVMQLQNILQNLLTTLDPEGKETIGNKGPMPNPMLVPEGNAPSQRPVDTKEPIPFPATNVNEATPLPKAVAQMIFKCRQTVQVQQWIKQIEAGVPVAHVPDAQNAELVQAVQVKYQAVVAWKAPEAPVPLPQPAEGMPAPAPEQAVVLARVQIQRIIAVWQELGPKVELTQQPAAQPTESPTLQAEGLFTLARLLRERGPAQSPRPTMGEQPSTQAVSFAQTSGENPQLGSSLEQWLGQQEGKQAIPVPELQISSDGGVKNILAFAAQLEGQQVIPEAEIPLETRMPLPQVERMVVQQMVDRIRVIHRNGGTQEIRMRLDPPELGHVHMRLEMDGNTVAARFTVESAVVKQALEANFAQLRDTLAEQGFKVEKFDVNVGYGNEQPAHGKDVQDQWVRRKGWTPSSSNEETEPDALSSLEYAASYGTDTGRRYGTNTIEVFG